LVPTPLRRFIQASRRVTNGIPLGCSLFLPIHTLICVQTLKAAPAAVVALAKRACATAPNDRPTFASIEAEVAVTLAPSNGSFIDVGRLINEHREKEMHDISTSNTQTRNQVFTDIKAGVENVNGFDGMDDDDGDGAQDESNAEEGAKQPGISATRRGSIRLDEPSSIAALSKTASEAPLFFNAAAWDMDAAGKVKRKASVKGKQRPTRFKRSETADSEASSNTAAPAPSNGFANVSAVVTLGKGIDRRRKQTTKHRLGTAATMLHQRFAAERAASGLTDDEEDD
jgi:hypothetical protein